MENHELEERAQQLVEKIAKRSCINSLGSATVAVYDTAWVSMITKNEEWLFPECFHYVLDTQSPDGGWGSGSSLDDDLLTTLAALAAMVSHAKLQRPDARSDPMNLNFRICQATGYLEANLRCWDVDAAMNVGFEFLIPALLSILENEQIFFSFPRRKVLNNMRALKMEKFDQELFYSFPNTFLHSLEGLVGQINFDRISHHKTFGSMMASPASTAAYLIHSSTWDDEAENYLRTVITEGAGEGRGGVPSVYPTPIFESTWVLTTLLENGFDASQLGENNINIIASYLQDHFQKQDGLLGFAPSVPADADDTAKALHTLNVLSRNANPSRMISHFRTDNGFFRTYPAERNASFSANCNALSALLHSPNVGDYAADIVTTASFLCDLWWKGDIRDKWNTSHQYSKMLLAEALTRLLYLWDIGLLNHLPELFLRERVPVVLIQILNQTLFAQTANGGWGSEISCETTAYGILTLKAVSSLPLHGLLNESIKSGILLGQHLLIRSENGWAKPTYVWIEKVTYGSATLSEAYCIAAMHALQQTPHAWSQKTVSLVDIPEKVVANLVAFFPSLEGLQSEPIWTMRASAVEACTFLPQLRSARADILPRQKEAKNKYMTYVPFIWILVNNLYHLDISADLLWDMMVLTVCNFRVDEYMETAVARFSEADLEQAKSIVQALCTVEQQEHSAKNGGGDGDFTSELESRTTESAITVNGFIANGADAIATEANEKYAVSLLVNFRAVIGHYTRAMLAYPQIVYASSADQSRFRYLLRTFLLSHIEQIADNSRFSTQTSWNASRTTIITGPRTSFYVWAHSIGADSISGPMSFAFLACLVGAMNSPLQEKRQRSATDCFESVRQKYLAEDLCSRLAVMSRLYNDFGSVVRDRLEANINSINFPEFHSHSSEGIVPAEHDSDSINEEKLKGDLLRLAQDERQNADVALLKLLSDLKGKPGYHRIGSQGRRVNAVRLFTGVTKLFADIYVSRDLSNRIRTSNGLL